MNPLVSGANRSEMLVVQYDGIVDMELYTVQRGPPPAALSPKYLVGITGVERLEP